MGKVAVVEPVLNKERAVNKITNLISSLKKKKYHNSDIKNLRLRMLTTTVSVIEDPRVFRRFADAPRSFQDCIKKAICQAENLRLRRIVGEPIDDRETDEEKYTDIKHTCVDLIHIYEDSKTNSTNL